MLTVNILGTDYKILIKKYDEEEAFKRRHIRGFCDSYSKELVVCDPATFPNWEHEARETVSLARQETLRHEIVHAFFHESGIADCSLQFEAGWTCNEEMIDWFALQGPKICGAWKEAGCL